MQTFIGWIEAMPGYIRNIQGAAFVNSHCPKNENVGHDLNFSSNADSKHSTWIGRAISNRETDTE